jgi:hypothetical protein
MGWDCISPSLLMKKPTDFLHPENEERNQSIITFNIYLNGLAYIDKFEFHAKVTNNYLHKILGKPEYRNGFLDIKLRGRLYPEKKLIVLYKPRFKISIKESLLIDELIKIFKLSSAVIYIDKLIENDFDELPLYNYDIIESMAINNWYKDSGIDLHICDPRIKKFIKEGMKYMEE